MRALLPCLALCLLSGCSLWLPRPDPTRAWIELDEAQHEDLRALQVDSKPWDDPRYFQLQPGAHNLTLAYRFAVTPHNSGRAEPLPRDCQLALEYPEFAAGQRYRVEAGAVGFRPWLRLRDEQGQVVARGQEQRCGAL